MRLNYEIFYLYPDSANKMQCRVCETECNVERDVYGPGNFAMAAFKVKDLFDVFTCPHAGQDWHEKALALVIEIEKQPSKRVAALIKQDLEDLLRENGIISR